MAKTSDHTQNDQASNHVETSPDPISGANGKKPFVEPEISSAVDVLEATTFFQGTTSGVTN